MDVIVCDHSFQVFLSGLFWFGHSNLLFGILSFVPSVTPGNKNFSSIVVMSERKVTCRYCLHAFHCFNSLTERFEFNIVSIKHESLYLCFFGKNRFGIFICMLYFDKSETKFVIHTLLTYFVGCGGFSNMG